MMKTRKVVFRDVVALSMALLMIGAVNGVASRIQPEKHDSFDMLLDSDRGMEDMWENASKVARSEIEALRLLQTDSMSMSLSSSNDMPRPPVQDPSQKPGPTPLPVISPTIMLPSESPLIQPGPTIVIPINCLVGKTRQEYIYEKLKLISEPEILLNPKTPQGMAYSYLVNDDPILLDPCSSSTIEQRFGLTTLYYSTNGDGWSDSSGWLDDDDECNWFGVDCDNSEDPNFVTRLLLRKWIN